MLVRLTAPMLGMIEGVSLPRDADTVIDLPAHAAKDLIKRELAVEVKAEAKVPAAEVEVRVVEAAEKRGPGRPAKASD